MSGGLLGPGDRLEDALAQPDLRHIAIDRRRQLALTAGRERKIERGLRRGATAVRRAAPDAAARVLARDRPVQRWRIA
jgi:hypothetical protein